MKRTIFYAILAVMMGCGSVAKKSVTASPKAPAISQIQATDPNPASPATTTQVGDIPFAGARVYLPATTPAPAIIFLHGSEGGGEKLIDEVAQEMSRAGFVTMVYCYFGCTGQPGTLKNVSLDNILRASDWLKTIPQVAGRKVGLMGWSRGAEKSVLLASLVKTTDKLAAVAAHAPLDYVVGAFNPQNPDAATNDAAWTWQGQAVPSYLNAVFEKILAQTNNATNSGTGTLGTNTTMQNDDMWTNSNWNDDQWNDGYDDTWGDDNWEDGNWGDDSWNDPFNDNMATGTTTPQLDQSNQQQDESFCLQPGQTAFMNTGLSAEQRLQPGVWGSQGMIHIEQYQGPLLLTHGKRDSLWPYEATKRLETLRKSGSSAPTVVHYYDDCHGLQSAANIAHFNKTLTAFFKQYLH